MQFLRITKDKTRKIILILFCATIGVLLVFDSRGIATSVSETLSLCLNTIIPSLFAFLVLSTFVVSSGLIKSDFAILVLSLVGGYPVGAKLLCDRVTKTENSSLFNFHQKNQKRAETMLMYCFCGSPVFLIGILGQNGLYIWLSNAIACLVFAGVISIILRRQSRDTSRQSHSANLSVQDGSVNIEPLGQIFVNSVTSAGITLWRICLMMLCFSVILRVIAFIGEITGITKIFHEIGISGLFPYAASMAEITNLSDLTPAFRTLPLVAAFTSFGGVCVIFQNFSIVKGKLKLQKFLLARIPIAILSAMMCYLLMAFKQAQTGQTVYAFAFGERTHVLLTSSPNIFATICLIFMTLILIQECHQTPKN